LTKVEHDLMVCAMEAWGILPYACPGVGSDVPISEPAEAVLSLVDRGLVGVHRLEAWTAPDGRAGATYGARLDRDELPTLLADPDTWDDPADVSWIGEVTLGRTPAWEPVGDDAPATSPGSDRTPRF
jgi:hypothetical protein